MDLWPLNCQNNIRGFQKNQKTQHVLLKRIETWRSKLICGNKIGALIMDFPKAFDTINHDLFLSKLKAYGFSENSYLTNRYQRTNIDNTFIDCKQIITGVPQISTLGPLLFSKIFVNNLIFICKQIWNLLIWTMLMTTLSTLLIKTDKS